MAWNPLARWLDRRAALRDLRKRQREEEVVLVGQDSNPLLGARNAADAGDLATAAVLWDKARVQMPNVVLTSPDSMGIMLKLGRFDEAEAMMYVKRRRSRLDQSYLIGLAQVAEWRGDFPPCQ